MSDNKEMLGTAPIGKLLFKLAVPTVVAQLINMLYNIVDRIYIGHMPRGRKPCAYGCWCMYADNYDNLGICSADCIRRCAEGVYLNGQGRQRFC